MPITLEDLIVSIVTAGICGAVGRSLAGEKPGGPIMSVTVGVIGGQLVAWGAHVFHLSEAVGHPVPGHLSPIAWAMVGTVLFVVLPLLASAGRAARAETRMARRDVAAARPWPTDTPEVLAAAASL